MSLPGVRFLAWVAACAALGSACSSTDGVVKAGNPHTAGVEVFEDVVCASMLVFHGLRYYGYGWAIREIRPGRSLGSGTLPGCGKGEPDERVHVTAIPGVDPEQAVLDTSGVWIAIDADLPAVVIASRRPVTCQWTQPHELTGQWISVSPRQSHFTELTPPYQIGATFEGAEMALPRWASVTVKIQVVDSTDPTLDRHDVEQALWEPGTLRVTVRCDTGRFIAVSASTEPPR